MKKLPLLACVVLLLFSCKKSESLDENNLKEPELIPVSFSADDFTQEIKDGTKISDTVSAKNVIRYLYYYVFEAEGGTGKIREIRQFKDTTANFGQIKDLLPPGTYHFVFIGSVNKVQTINIKSFSSSYFYITTGDYFYKRRTLTVSQSPVNEDIILERIIGKLTVKLKDKVPQNVSNMRYYFKFSPFYYFDGQTPVYPARNPNIFQARLSPGTLFKPVSSVNVNTKMPFDVVIRAFTADNVLVKEKIVRDVTVSRNRETVLTGYLFSSETSFSVSINDQWSDETNVIEF